MLDTFPSLPSPPLPFPSREGEGQPQESLPKVLPRSRLIALQPGRDSARGLRRPTRCHQAADIPYRYRRLLGQMAGPPRMAQAESTRRDDHQDSTAVDRGGTRGEARCRQSGHEAGWGLTAARSRWYRSPSWCTRTFTLPARMATTVHSGTLEPAPSPNTATDHLTVLTSSNLLAGAVTKQPRRSSCLVVAMVHRSKLPARSAPNGGCTEKTLSRGQTPRRDGLSKWYRTNCVWTDYDQAVQNSTTWIILGGTCGKSKRIIQHTTGSLLYIQYTTYRWYIVEVDTILLAAQHGFKPQLKSQRVWSLDLVLGLPGSPPGGGRK